jgi:hypothetical protein
VLAGRRADPDARVVDQHVEAPEPLPVPRHDVADRLVVGHVGRDVLDVVPLRTQRLRRLLERVGLAGAEREPVPLLAERLGEREPDAAGGSGDDRGAICHGVRILAGDDERARSPTGGVGRSSGGLDKLK